MTVNRILLSDAEMREDVVKGLLRCDTILARDVGKVIDDQAEIFGKEVGREAGAHPCYDTLEILMGMHEVGMMPGIGHDDILGRQFGKVETGADRFLQRCHSLSLLGTDLHTRDAGRQDRRLMGQVCFVEYGKEMLAGRQRLHVVDLLLCRLPVDDPQHDIGLLGCA